MLEVKNLSIKYKSTGPKVVDNISFSVKKGEIVAIMGPSGCGKTTLLTAIAGLIPSKQAKIEGKLNYGKSKTIRFVFQEPLLLPWRNVYENVAFGLEAVSNGGDIDSEQIERMLKLIGLSGYKKYYPRQLSLGMQQRVNFARALSCNPNILFLDEPFSSLDSFTKTPLMEEFLDILKKLQITAVFVTHNANEARFLADRIIFLSNQPATIKKTTDKVDFYNDESLYV